MYDVSLLQEKFRDRVQFNSRMSSYTSFKIGGAADIVVFPENIDELSFVLDYIIKNNIPYEVIGNGTNILVSDQGIDGIVLILTKMQHITIEDNKISVAAGNLFSEVAQFAMKNNLSGLEFAGGIPGSVGGAIYMNAGAYGSEVKNVIHNVTYMDLNSKICNLTLADLELDYRYSVFQKNRSIILSATFELEKNNDPEQIKAIMQKNNKKRRTKQPLNYPSAGSVFKRPKGNYAAKLIEDSGLKGYRIGGAMVSEKHAGFIVNYNNATAEDVMNLIEVIRDIVDKKFSVTLEPEVKFIGRF